MGGAVTDQLGVVERALLDTSVVIAENVSPVPGVLAISAVTLAELHFGVLVAKTSQVRAERLRRLSVLERRFDPLPVDEQVAASYGRLAEAVVQAGRRPRGRVMDLLIAATAHAHGAALYTRNPDDFVGLEGLVDVQAV
ncbi:MAG: type II toxin-antitoxin system VapC family toxin [Mobilicoccus sp.]|nr:type II toxin-antitoxin system VapC family toxin [Mobilicoccus sp.]